MSTEPHPLKWILLVLLSIAYTMSHGGSKEAVEGAETADRKAIIEKVIRFFETIPKGGPQESKLKCYRKEASTDIMLEFYWAKDRELGRDSLMNILGTYFIVQEIRDLAKHGVRVILVEYDLKGKELRRSEVAFREVIPYFNGHNF